MVLSDTEANDIQQRTEGWVTGIVLASQMNTNEEISRARLKRVSSFGLDSYFLHIIDALPLELRSFLLWSSLLEEFNAELCTSVLSPALLMNDVPWQQWMYAIQHDNLFVLSVGERGDWIRYHPLFLDFLQTRARLEFPVESRKIDLQLARDCLMRKEWERAYLIYEKLQLTDEKIQLIEEIGFYILLDGKVSLLASWIDALDSEVLQDHPYIISLKGYISMLLGDKSLAVTLYSQAASLLEESKDDEHLARTLAMRANIQRLQGSLDEAIQDIHQTEVLIKSNPDLLNLKGEVLRCKGLCYFHRGKLHDALLWLKKAQEAFQHTQDYKTEAIVQMEIGLVHEQLGKYTEAKEWYNKALVYWQDVDNPFWLANLLNNLGVLYQMLGDYENCIMAFEKALVYTESTGYSRMEAFILTGIADVNLDLQSYENAQAGYEKALGIAGTIQEHFLQVYILLQQASIAGYSGKFAEGYRLVKLAQELVGTIGSEMESNLCDLEFAALKTMENKGIEVQKVLERVSQYFKKAGHKAQYDRAVIFMIIAGIQSHKIDQIISQMLYLTASLESGAPVNGIIAEASKFASLLLQPGNDYLQDKYLILARYVNEFIAQIPKAKKFIRENSHRIQLSAPKYFVRSLGKMQVKINEHLVTKSEWQTQAAKNLLFILLAHPEGMTKDEICLIF